MATAVDIVKWMNREIDKIREPRGRTATVEALAKRLGIAKVTLYGRLRGETEFTTDEIIKAAEFFGVEPPIKGHLAPNNVVALRPAMSPDETIGYPVLGAVEAGAFREADMLSQVEPRTVQDVRDATYPNATPMAWEARGNSMNKEGIIDGTILIGVDFNEAGAPLRNDTIVVVEQNRGGMIERSVKAVVIFPDRIEFQPRSTDARHKPIVYKNGSHDDDALVRILTVVRVIRTYVG